MMVEAEHEVSASVIASVTHSGWTIHHGSPPTLSHLKQSEVCEQTGEGSDLAMQGEGSDRCSSNGSYVCTNVRLIFA
jgi:hypothetical protein